MFWYIFFRKAIAAKLETLGGKEFKLFMSQSFVLKCWFVFAVFKLMHNLKKKCM